MSFVVERTMNVHISSCITQTIHGTGNFRFSSATLPASAIVCLPTANMFSLYLLVDSVCLWTIFFSLLAAQLSTFRVLSEIIMKYDDVSLSMTKTLIYATTAYAILPYRTLSIWIECQCVYVVCRGQILILRRTFKSDIKTPALISMWEKSRSIIGNTNTSLSKCRIFHILAGTICAIYSATLYISCSNLSTWRHFVVDVVLATLVIGCSHLVRRWPQALKRYPNIN